MSALQIPADQLSSMLSDAEADFKRHCDAQLALDLTRGKPGAEQLDLSNTLDGLLAGNYRSEDGTDLRNYGGLDGLPAAKQLFAKMIDCDANDVVVGGNSSLQLMYFSTLFALTQGVGEYPSWQTQGTVKFLAPAPGYDRHFALCEQLGIELIPVGINDDGPDMEAIETLLKNDSSIKGIWCVPRFSNPTGCVYSDEVVKRFARLGHIAAPDFRIFWDNAYAVHSLEDDAPQLASIGEACAAEGTSDSVYQFGSTSKITFAGAGVAFVAMSESNRKSFLKNMAFTSIGPDKLNQQRHIELLKDEVGVKAHMKQHAAIIKPKFDAVLSRLEKGLADADFGQWTQPQGGYFISFDSRPGLAGEIIKLAAEAGVKLTPAGATFPYGKDPQDCNIRLAPTFPSLQEVEQASDVFVSCVRLATLRAAQAS